MKQNDYVTLCPFNGHMDTVGSHDFCFQPLMQHSLQGRLMFKSNAEMVWKNTVRKQRKKLRLYIVLQLHPPVTKANGGLTATCSGR
jgi:hypothetical protein